MKTTFKTKDIRNFLKEMELWYATYRWEADFKTKVVEYSEAKNWFQAQQTLGTVHQMAFRHMEAQCTAFIEWKEL